eukprot:3483634-Karenia_brevis.AAC.1
MHEESSNHRNSCMLHGKPSTQQRQQSEVHEGAPNHDKPSTFHGSSFISNGAPEEPRGMKCYLAIANHVF